VPTCDLHRLFGDLTSKVPDAGRKGNYQLEGEAGYRGVAPLSAEMQIFLPGSDGWIFDGEDVPEVL
jgi:hypothetical protein